MKRYPPVRSPDEIDPARLYCIREAAQYVPSRNGGPVGREGVRHLIRAGHLKATRWPGAVMVRGRDLLALVGEPAPRKARTRTAAQRAKDHEDDLRALREQGYKV